MSFYGISSENRVNIYVPSGAGAAYRNHSDWKYFSDLEYVDIIEDNIEIDVQEKEATIVWSKLSDKAEDYSIILYGNEEKTDIIEEYQFDQDGNKLRAGTTDGKLLFSIPNLSTGTTYFYELLTKGANESILMRSAGSFTTLGEKTDIENIPAEPAEAKIIAYYSITGAKLYKKPVSGLYIIQYDNGKVEKVFIK